jgi:hypothetical protein
MIIAKKQVLICVCFSFVIPFRLPRTSDPCLLPFVKFRAPVHCH